MLLVLLSAIGLAAGASTAPACDALLNAGRLFHVQFPDLHRRPVLAVATPGAKPHVRIASWLTSLSFDEALRAEILGHVIRPAEFPESYFEAVRRREREEGRGDRELTGALRDRLIQQAVAEQIDSLDAWWTALRDHPRPWVAYWVLRNVVGLLPYDPIRGGFGLRRTGQTAAFPDLDPRALTWVMDLVHEIVTELAHEPAEVRRGAFADLSFRKLYAAHVRARRPGLLKSTAGRWQTFPRGSDPARLVASLAGHHTGWCSTSITTARGQLAEGDLHVYFSNDEDGMAVVPRLAVRMARAQIAEVRGIGFKQALDDDLAASDVLSARLAAMGPVGAQYLTRLAHVRRLTALEKKPAWSAADLRFIFELDGPIQDFGYHRDPRIVRLRRQRRRPRQDLARALGVDPARISTTVRAARDPRVVAHLGDLRLDAVRGADVHLPRYVIGSVELPHLTDAHGLRLPHVITGGLKMLNLTDLDGVELRGLVHGDLEANQVERARNVLMPSVFGSIEMNGLRTARGLTFSGSMRGWLFLANLSSAEDVILPEAASSVILNELERAAGVTLPRRVFDHLRLRAMNAAELTTWPEVGGVITLKDRIIGTD